MTTTRGYTAVRIDFVDARAEKLSFTAKKDILIQGVNGASVHIKSGEKFTAVRATSLEENMWYIVRQVSGSKKCSCASTKPCKHEKCVATGRSLADLQAESEARAKSRKPAKAAKVVEPPAPPVEQPERWNTPLMEQRARTKALADARFGKKRDMLGTPLNGNRGFQLPTAS